VLVPLLRGLDDLEDKRILLSNTPEHRNPEVTRSIDI
jgi:hypothetical protein